MYYEKDILQKISYRRKKNIKSGYEKDCLKKETYKERGIYRKRQSKKGVIQRKRE